MTNIELVAEVTELRERNRELSRENGKLRTRLKLYDSMKALMFRQEAELTTLRRKAHADECRLNRLQKLQVVVRKPSDDRASEYLGDWWPSERKGKSFRKFVDRLPKDPKEY